MQNSFTYKNVQKNSLCEWNEHYKLNNVIESLFTLLVKKREI